MGEILFKNGKIFDGENYIESDLLVKDDKIFKIGKNLGKAQHEIDIKDCIVTYSLADIHTHLLEMGSKEFGYPGNMATIPFGVTLAVDACAERVDRVSELYIDSFVFVPIIFNNGEVNEPKTDALLSLYKAKAIGVKVYFDLTMNAQITLDCLKKACTYAKKRDKIVMVHCAYSPVSMEQIVEVLSGGDILTHIYHGGENTIEENDYSAYIKAKEKGVTLDAGMAGGVHTDFAVLKRALEKGYAPDTISSDITKLSAYLRGGVYGLSECMSIMRHLGMAERDILRAVTVTPRLALLNHAPRLTEGERADLCVIKYTDEEIDITDKAGNRLKIDRGYQNRITVYGGQILYRR